MNPWWLRPTAESADEPEKTDPQDSPRQRSPKKTADQPDAPSGAGAEQPPASIAPKRTAKDEPKGRTKGDGDGAAPDDSEGASRGRQAGGRGRGAKEAGAETAAADEKRPTRARRPSRARSQPAEKKATEEPAGERQAEPPAAQAADTTADEATDKQPDRPAAERRGRDETDERPARRSREDGEERRPRRGGAEPEERPARRAADETDDRSARRPRDEQAERRGNGGARNGDAAPRPRREREAFVFEDEITPADFAALRQEIVSSPERNQSVSDERKIALFCDLENVALGVRDSEIKKFDIGLVLERLLEKGKIIVKKAYCDWERYSEYKRQFHESAIEMIDIPQKYYSGKNSADIKMVVDAMDLCYAKEHLDTFVLLSGDSDFSPLVSKLKENNKYVIGIGVKGSSSALLVDNCDEFIYYEDVWRDRQSAPKVDSNDKKKTEAFRLMVDAIQALLRENKDVLWGSMIKQTMQRKKPSFNEGYYGYSTFSELLEDAERNTLIKLKKDQRSGTYIVTGFSGTTGGGGRGGRG
ncbi:MAG TPA: NYN domain-containing protein [Thermoanaerobaculia bacterium]|nr:NYN domain-containing protein [Thermoanaerobaculia bacterium]